MKRPERINLYHRDFGFPVWFDRDRYIKYLPDVLVGGQHYMLRAHYKGLPGKVERAWVEQADLIEVQCSAYDNAVLRYLVRGSGYIKLPGQTIAAKQELSVVIDAATGELVTGWWNNDDDQHRLTSERSQEYSGARQRLLGFAMLGMMHNNPAAIGRALLADLADEAGLEHD